MMLFSPIVKKDIEVRSRSYSLPAILAAVNSVLFLVGLMGTFGLITGMKQSSQTFYRGFLTVYVIVVMTEYIIILFTAPLFTASSISGERQTGTFDLLLTTSLSPADIVKEKLVSAMLSMGMIISSFLPAMLIPLMFGGVSLVDTLLMLTAFFPGAFFMLSVGMLASAVSHSVTKSFAIAYGTALFVTAGFIMLPVLTRLFVSSNNNGLAYILAFDPILPVAALLAAQTGEEGFIRLLFEFMRLEPETAFLEHTVLISMVLQTAAGIGLTVLAILNVMPWRYKEWRRHT